MGICGTQIDKEKRKNSSSIESFKIEEMKNSSNTEDLKRRKEIVVIPKLLKKRKGRILVISMHLKKGQV